MRDLVVLFIHFIATLARLLGPGGARSIVAESLLLKHQLLIVNRSRHRSPNLSASDRILVGLLTFLVRPTRVTREIFARAWTRRNHLRLRSPGAWRDGALGQIAVGRKGRCCVRWRPSKVEDAG